MCKDNVQCTFAHFGQGGPEPGRVSRCAHRLYACAYDGCGSFSTPEVHQMVTSDHTALRVDLCLYRGLFSSWMGQYTPADSSEFFCSFSLLASRNIIHDKGSVISSVRTSFLENSDCLCLSFSASLNIYR